MNTSEIKPSWGIWANDSGQMFGDTLTRAAGGEKSRNIGSISFDVWVDRMKSIAIYADFVELCEQVRCASSEDVYRFLDGYFSFIQDKRNADSIYGICSSDSYSYDYELEPVHLFLERAYTSGVLESCESEKLLAPFRYALDSLPQFEDPEHMPRPIVPATYARPIDVSGVRMYGTQQVNDSRADRYIDPVYLDEHENGLDEEGTHYARCILSALAPYVSQDAIGPLLDALRRSSFFGFRADLPNILSQIDGVEAAQQIIHRLNNTQLQRDMVSKPGEAQYYQDLLRLLHQIDLGDMEISDGAIQYMDSIITLDMPVDGRARRLTRDGVCAIFSRDNILTHITTPSESDAGVSWHHVQKIIIDHIVSNPAERDTDEHRVQGELLALFQTQYYHVLDTMQVPLIAILLSTVSLREQAGIVSLLVKSTEFDKRRIESICHKYGVSGIRLCALIGQFGVSLDDIERLPHVFVDERDTVSMINAYARLEQHIDEVRHTYTKKGALYDYRICAMAQIRLRSGIAALRGASVGSITPESVRHLFAEINEEIFLLASCLREYRSQGDEESVRKYIHDMDCIVDSGQTLIDDMKNKLHAMMLRNYIDDTGSVSEYGKKVALPSLLDAFDSGQSCFYILAHTDNPVAFVRFDDRGDHYYAGSFNVSRDAQQSGIGEVFLKQTLQQVSEKQKPIRAIAEIHKPIAARYVNQFGFVITGLEQNKEGSGIGIFNIERSERYQKDRLEETDIVVTLVESDPVIYQQVQEQVSKYIADGYVGTQISRLGGRSIISFSRVGEDQQLSRAA